MVDLKIFTENIEKEALEQINNIMKIDVFSECKVRIMPDVHAGKGCVIGFTADLGDKVIPNIVGVDIGCGMLSVYIGNTEIDFNKLDDVIRKYIPFGKNVHQGRIVRFRELQDLYCYRDLKDSRRLERSIGTLGGGNHFIEVGKDIVNGKYIIIHTGSRNLGKQVAEYYQKLAVELMQGKNELIEKQNKIIEEYKAQGRKSEIQQAIKELRKKYSPKELKITKELCYLTGEYRQKYLHDMEICQRFAQRNRRAIADIILGNMGLEEKSSFETVHNYIDIESNIVRKGAISAKKGEKVLIPLNMRDGCIVAIGKGNEDWNCSAPHGAGRIMSRTRAKEMLSMKDYQKSMNDIFTTCVNESTIDESPMAYRPKREILDNIKDTVDVIDIIKPLYNFKADE